MAENHEEVYKTIVGEALREIPGLVEQQAKSKAYARLMIGKTTLAYLWDSKLGTKVDLYVSADSLPKSITAFKPARGRARKEGLIATVANPTKRDVEQVVEGIKVAAQFAGETKTEEPQSEGEEPSPEQELDTDLGKAAAAADANSRRATAKRQAKPDPKPKKRKKRKKAKA